MHIYVSTYLACRVFRKSTYLCLGEESFTIGDKKDRLVHPGLNKYTRLDALFEGGYSARAIARNGASK